MPDTPKTPETPKTPDIPSSLTSEFTCDRFRPYVEKTIRRWKTGDLFVHCGISESEPILTNRDQIPSKEEKDHPFIKFMDVVVKDVVVGEELKDKKARKMIAKLLRRENEEYKVLKLMENN